MKVRLDPSDEGMHPGPEPTFNESMYLNAYDPVARTGGFVRIGNRPNEHHAEMTVCLYLPDGRVAFTFRRVDIDANERFDAGGATIEVIEPFRTDGDGGGRLRVTYDGPLLLLDDPLDMSDPRRAFADNPTGTAAVDLTFVGTSRPFGGEPEEHHERSGEEFAKGHYEQLVAATGTVAVDDADWTVEGRGLRDHSWGPRTWQAPWYYRWLTMNFADGTGLMLSRIARPDGPGTRGGFVWDGLDLHVVGDMTISTEWVGDDRHHRRIDASFTTVGDRARDPISRRVSGDVVNLIPLRNRRDGRVTRISEGLTRWRLDEAIGDDPDAVDGHGLSEYLDQILDDGPAGVDE